MNCIFGTSTPFETKKTPITDNYTITKSVLGVGINGKVVECVEKKTGNKYALKVSRLLEQLAYIISDGIRSKICVLVVNLL